MIKLSSIQNRLPKSGPLGIAAAHAALEFAYVSSFLNIPVYKTTNVEGTNSAGHDNTLFQKESIALVMQMAPQMHSMFDIDYFADKVAIEQLYGTQEMRDDHGVWIKGA